MPDFGTPPGVANPASRSGRSIGPVRDRVDEVDLGPLGVEQPGGLVEDPLEQRLGVPDGGDPGGDVTQCPLCVGPICGLFARHAECLDEPGVGEGDAGLPGQDLQPLGIDLAEGVGLA